MLKGSTLTLSCQQMHCYRWTIITLNVLFKYMKRHAQNSSGITTSVIMYHWHITAVETRSYLLQSGCKNSK